MAKYNYIFEIDCIINDAKQGVCPGEEEIKILEDLKDKIKEYQETESLKSVGVNRLVKKITKEMNKSLVEYFTTTKTAKELATEIYEKAKNGISFSDLAKEYNLSECTIEYLYIAGHISKNE